MESLTHYTVNGIPRCQKTISKNGSEVCIIDPMDAHDPGDVTVVDETAYDALVASHEADIAAARTQMAQDHADNRATRDTSIASLKAELAGLGITPALLDAVLG